jgi:hypothetical protein
MPPPRETIMGRSGSGRDPGPPSGTPTAPEGHRGVRASAGQDRSVAGVAASLVVGAVWVAAQLASSLSASSEGVPGSAV